MTEYALTEGYNKPVVDYPYTPRKFYRDNPGVSWRGKFEDIPLDLLMARNIFVVNPTSEPAYDKTKNVAVGTPEWVGGILCQKWDVTDADPAEVAKRNKQERYTNEEDNLAVDQFVKALLNMTDNDIDQYMASNITNIPSAQVTIGRLAKIVKVLARKVFNGA